MVEYKSQMSVWLWERGNCYSRDRGLTEVVRQMSALEIECCGHLTISESAMGEQPQ